MTIARQFSGRGRNAVCKTALPSQNLFPPNYLVSRWPFFNRGQTIYLILTSSHLARDLHKKYSCFGDLLIFKISKWPEFAILPGWQDSFQESFWCQVSNSTLTARSISLHSTFRSGVAKRFSLKEWKRDVGCAERGNETGGNEHDPLFPRRSSPLALATFRGRGRVMLCFHLLFFRLTVKASPKTELNLDNIQSAFSSLEQGGALAYCITDNTPGDKCGLL